MTIATEIIIIALLFVFIIGLLIPLTFAVHYENYIVRNHFGDEHIESVKERHSIKVNTKYEQILINLIKRGGK